MLSTLGLVILLTFIYFGYTVLAPNGNFLEAVVATISVLGATLGTTRVFKADSEGILGVNQRASPDSNDSDIETTVDFLVEAYQKMKSQKSEDQFFFHQVSNSPDSNQ